MADTYTISAAARLCRRDRRTLQRAIRAGYLHLDTPHSIAFSGDAPILSPYA
jgi:hypothetical protein